MPLLIDKGVWRVVWNQVHEIVNEPLSEMVITLLPPQEAISVPMIDVCPNLFLEKAIEKADCNFQVQFKVFILVYKYLQGT